MKVGLARVSTKKKEQDVSIAAQEKQLLDAGCDRVITVRESAYKGPRKGWQELRSLVAGGSVTEVICIDQSRLARDGSDMQFLEECAIRNVTVRALTGGVIETSSVGGFVQAGVFSVINQAYSRQVGVKTKDGLDRGKKEGRYMCGRVPFGYRYDKEAGVVEPDPTDWPLARQMFEELLAMGMNINAYVREHRSSWSATGIRGWIRNPILQGVVAHQGNVKALFSAEEWAQATRMLDHRKGSKSSYKRTVHLFTGLVKCSSCSKNLKYKKVRAGAKRLHCANPSCNCYGKGVAVPLVRQQVIDALRQFAESMKANVSQNGDDINAAARAEVEAEIQKLKQVQLENGWDLSTNINQELAKLEALTPLNAPNWDGLVPLLETPGVLEGFSDAELRTLVIEYITQIFYIGNPRSVDVRIRQST